MPEPIFGPEEFGAQTGVSRETLVRLKIYADLITDWSTRQNLVAMSTLPGLWYRHFLDCAQLSALIPNTARTVADLGSGAGFPGLVLATMRPDLQISLYEATTKKCAFLREAAERMGLTVGVRNTRLEDQCPQIFDIVTARALAPLPLLLDYAQRFTGANTVCLFLKGQNLGVELTEASKYWKMKFSLVPSQTNPSATILVVRELDPLNVTNTAVQKVARAGDRQSKRRGR